MKHIQIRGFVRTKGATEYFPCTLAAWIEDRGTHKMLSLSNDLPSPFKLVANTIGWADIEGPTVVLENDLWTNMQFLTKQSELHGCCCADWEAVT